VEDLIPGNLQGITLGKQIRFMLLPIPNWWTELTKPVSLERLPPLFMANSRATSLLLFWISIVFRRLWTPLLSTDPRFAGRCQIFFQLSLLWTAIGSATQDQGIHLLQARSGPLTLTGLTSQVP
jgi:hypothetical protein